MELIVISALAGYVLGVTVMGIADAIANDGKRKKGRHEAAER